MKSIITDWKLWFVNNCEAFLAFWFLKKPGKSVSGVTTDLRWCISALQKKFLQMHKPGRCVQQSTVQCSAKQRWHGQSMALLPRRDKWTHTRVYVTKRAGSSQPGTSSWSCTVRCVCNYTQSHSPVSVNGKKGSLLSPGHYWLWNNAHSSNSVNYFSFA